MTPANCRNLFKEESPQFCFAKFSGVLQTELIHRRFLFTANVCLVLLACGVLAADYTFEGVNPIPPLGIAVPAAARAELEKGVADFGEELDSLRTECPKNRSLSICCRKSRFITKQWSGRCDRIHYNHYFAAPNYTNSNPRFCPSFHASEIFIRHPINASMTKKAAKSSL
jgi:hypothetical protein